MQGAVAEALALNYRSAGNPRWSRRRQRPQRYLVRTSTELSNEFARAMTVMAAGVAELINAAGIFRSYNESG